MLAPLEQPRTAKYVHALRLCWNNLKDSSPLAGSGSLSINLFHWHAGKITSRNLRCKISVTFLLRSWEFTAAAPFGKYVPNGDNQKLKEINMNNLVQLKGNLGKDPVIKSLDENKQVTQFSIAVNKSWTKNGVKSTKTDWFQVEVWGRLARPASRLKKGDAVFIQGELRTGEYEKDGVKHFPTTVNAFCLYKLDFSIFKADEESDDPESTVPEEDPVPF
jgi:single stranded DNA-binding protein